MHYADFEKERYEKIRTLYGDRADFVYVHFYICQILTGYDESAAIKKSGAGQYILPFDINHCQIIITGIPQDICGSRYGWTQENLLDCFAFSFQPMVKELLKESGYQGDSYIFLFDSSKFFVTIFSPQTGRHQRPAEEVNIKIHDHLQALYTDALFHDDLPPSNFTVLSGPICGYNGISSEFSKVRKQKACHYFIHQCIAVNQDWIAAHKKRFIHLSYNNVRMKFRTDLMQNKTERLQEYLRVLFYDYIIPSYDFCELKELLLFLRGNMKIYSMVYKQEDKLDLSVFDCTRYDFADDCYAVMRNVLSQITQTTNNKNNYSDVIVNTLTYIQMNYQRPVSINEIADEVHLSPTYLSRIVAKETGITIHNHLLNIRMKNAETLLTKTGLSVSQVSKKVGYESIKYFSKKFREHTGMTPSEYRKQMKDMFKK